MVIRNLLRMVICACCSIDPNLKGRSRMSRLLRKRAGDLKHRQARRLDDNLDRQPAIEGIYRLKEDLMEVLTARNQSNG